MNIKEDILNFMQTELKLQSLGINLTNKCNAACRHCANYSSPLEAFKIEKEILNNIKSCFINVKEIGITGGEPFIDYELLEYTFSLFGNINTHFAIMTNGYFFNDYSLYKKRLKKLKKLSKFDIYYSTDIFHQEFIEIEALIKSIQIAQKLGIQNELIYNTYRNDISLKKYMDTIIDKNIKLKISNINPIGRAETLKNINYYYINRELLKEPCKMMGELFITAGGNIFICCNFNIKKELFSKSHYFIGNTYEYSLENLKQKIYSNPLFYVIRKNGISELIDILITKYPYIKNDNFLDKNKYTSQCEVCNHIFYTYNHEIESLINIFT